MYNWFFQRFISSPTSIMANNKDLCLSLSPSILTSQTALSLSNSAPPCFLQLTLMAYPKAAFLKLGYAEIKGSEG